MADQTDDLEYQIGEAPQEQPKSYTLGEAFQAAPRNFIPSAVEVGKSVISPFLNPRETAEGMKQVGIGAYSKAKGALGYEQDPEQKAADEAALNAVAQHYKDRYGTAEGWKKAIAEDPAGLIADLSSIATLGGGTAARLPGVLGKTGKIVSKVGEYTDPISLTAKSAKGVKYASAVPLWWKSGANYESLIRAAEAGGQANPEFLRHISGVGKPEEIIDSVATSINKIADEKNATYQAGMKSLNATQPLNYNDIVKTWDKQYESATHLGKVYDERTLEALNRAGMKIKEWVDQPAVEGAHSMYDLDKLKRAISEIRADYPINSPAGKALTNVRKSIYDTISTADPKYAEIMEDYQNRLDEIKNLRHDLGTNKKGVTKKVKAIIAAQKTPEGREMIKRLEEIDPDLPFKVAGSELSESLPYGMRGWISNAALGYGTGGLGLPIGLVMSSPKFGGATQYAIGSVAEGIPKGVEKYVPRMARAGEYALAEVAGLAQPQVQEDGQIKQPSMPELTEDMEYEIGRMDGGRVSRASGGRISPNSAAQKLMIAAEKAKRNISKTTETLLDHPDEHIAKALDIAKQHI